MKHAAKLEDNKLWQQVMQIAVDAYATVADLPEEEQYDMKSRVHQNAFMATDAVAAAGGSLDPRDQVWFLGKARAYLFSIKSAYVLAHKTGELPDKSEIMVLIEQSVKLIDQELQGTDAAIQKWYESLRDKTRENKA